MPGPDPNAPPVDPLSRVWLTLVTRASYLPGAALLIDSLYAARSAHPLIVQYTDSLAPECVRTLQALRTRHPLLRLQRVAPIPLPPGLAPVAPRFADTLTKLRAFEPLDPAAVDLPGPVAECCFLDADMLIRRNMDDVFDVPRPGPDWIAAHHACICNRDNDPWARPWWNPQTCPATPLAHPAALGAPVPARGGPDPRGDTYALLNSGVFVCTPSPELWARIEHFRTHDPRVKDFTFPDQDFLVAFFRDRWVPVGWQYNASKTGRYWHPASWRDAEVRGMHYIVDKPWSKRIGADGVAGYLGRDGVTHGWWWRAWEAWERDMEREGRGEELAVVRKYVAPPLEEGA